MRFFFAAMTVGAAGIGYVYLHQPSVPAAEMTSTERRPLYDWRSADDTLNAATTDIAGPGHEPPLVVRDTLQKARTEITSVLDEFVRVNGESDAAPMQSDIVTQADGLVAATPSTGDEALVPFATSDVPASIESDLAPVDANPESASTSPVGSNPSKSQTALPASSDTSQITRLTPTSDSSRPRTDDVAAKPNKTELLPGKSPEKAAPVFDQTWTVIGKTPNGTMMHSRRFGRQGTRVLVIAGLDGRDLTGTRWNDELAETLTRRTELLQANEILILRAGNPDGLLKKVSTNSHGVLINRNFPGRRYQFLSDATAGPGPGSEPETKAILQVLYTFRPRRVIHLSSTTGPSLVNYNRAAEPISAALHKQFQLNVAPLDVELVPGSIEDFADGTVDASVLSLKLNRGPDWQTAWKNNLPVVLTAINGQSPEKVLPVSDDLANSSPDQTGTKLPKVDEQPVFKKERRGYEELPAPPKP